MGGKGSGRRPRTLTPVKPLPAVRPTCRRCGRGKVERSVNVYRGRRQPIYRTLCSACRHRDKYRPVPRTDKPCVTCGRIFAAYPKHRFCSQSCRWAWKFQRFTHRHYVTDTCAHCGLTDPDPKFFDVDHIVPVSRGGARKDPANLQTLCPNCHRRKTLRDGPNTNQC